MANARRVSSAFDRTIISLPLSEYAWSLIIPNEAAIHWNREQSSDLSAVLEYAPYTDDGSIQLRIVQATRTIETVRLSELAREARTIADILQRSQGNYNVNALPIFAITRNKNLAMRHTAAKQPKRSQMYFLSEAQCGQFVNVLKTTELIWSEPKPLQRTLRPQSAPGFDARPTSSARFSDRPSSNMGPPLSPFRPSINPLRKSAQSYEEHEKEAESTSYYRDHPHHPESLPLSSPTSRQYSSPRRETYDALPETRQDTSEDYRELPKYADSSSPYFSGNHGQETRSTSSSTLQQRASTHNVPSPNDWQSSLPAGNSGNHSISRPYTAPEVSTPITLQDLLPPRRELPFGKPSAYNGAKETHPKPASSRPLSSAGPLDSSRRSSSAGELPPLPSPNYTNAWPLTGKRKRVDESSNDTGKTPVAEPNRRASQILSDPASKVPRLSTPAGPTRFAPSHQHDELYDVIPRDASPQGDESSITFHGDRPGSSQSTDVASPYQSDTLLSSSPYRASPGLSSPRFSSPSPSRIPMGEHRSSTALSERDINRAPQSQQPSLPTSNPEADELARYSTLPPQERDDWLSNFICCQLEDENFLQLCVDVEGCWRRKFLDQRRS